MRSGRQKSLTWYLAHSRWSGKDSFIQIPISALQFHHVLMATSPAQQERYLISTNSAVRRCFLKTQFRAAGLQKIPTINKWNPNGSFASPRFRAQVQSPVTRVPGQPAKANLSLPCSQRVDGKLEGTELALGN